MRLHNRRNGIIGGHRETAREGGRNLIFRNNTIRIDSIGEEKLPYRGSVFVENAEGVHVSGNTFIATPETPAAGLIVKDFVQQV